MEQRKPLDGEQLAHILARTDAMLTYLYRLREALRKRQHDGRHTYFRVVERTWRYTIALHRATRFCIQGYSWSQIHGTLAEEPLSWCAEGPPELWCGEGI